MKWLRIIFLIFLTASIVVFALKFQKSKKIPTSLVSNSPASSLVLPNDAYKNEISKTTDQPSPEFFPPLDNARERITKKPFEIFVIPKNSPVQPERFTGYHTGADFEIFSDEINQDLPVRAVCQGKFILKKYASGYGGVAVQNCLFNQQPITVIYGHLKLDSLKISVGQDIKKGDILGVLGKGYSTETDGERKHLHLGIHKGSEIDIRGYVSSPGELNSWINPASLIFKN